ncbi:hypothetical protein L3X38_043282 [Prunus dulcis]|uniref:acid phosphatase n=1 Tax=Prunus dulcis TaxID=3755 RepID=A0AAD4YM01_PRUDU|nr:hypothetical protein L3X38_043282 [Prunus dulcis]
MGHGGGTRLQYSALLERIQQETEIRGQIQDVPYTFGLIGEYFVSEQGCIVKLPVFVKCKLFHSNVTWVSFSGNHDIDFAPEIGEPEPFKPYTYLYPVPHNASGSTSPLWYSIKRVSAYIIVLSSYSAYGKYTPQNRWIEEELPKVNRSETSRLIVLMHSPWYNSYTIHYMEGETMRVMYESLFVKYKVDVVFAGHVHAYERSHRISNVTYNIVNGICIPVKNQSAPVYITIGDGGNIEGLATNMTKPQPAYSSFREAITADSMWFFNRYYHPDDDSTSAQHY